MELFMKQSILYKILIREVEIWDMFCELNVWLTFTI